MQSYLYSRCCCLGSLISICRWCISKGRGEQSIWLALVDSLLSAQAFINVTSQPQRAPPQKWRGPRLQAVDLRQGYDRWCGSVSICTFIFISFSRIWTSCCMEGKWPDSNLDQTGTSFSVISKAPVDIH